MTPEIHVHDSPSRCPYCKDALGDVRDIVACASCGARHHSACRATHGRCAVCSSVEVLVYGKPPEAVPVGAVGESALVVVRLGGVTTYYWKLLAKEGLALVPRTGFVRLAETELAFLATESRTLYEVRGAWPEVGEVTLVGRRLLVDVGPDEHQVATEAIGHTLEEADLATLEAAMEAWKRR